ncbi:MAG: TetR/AcrR family transcriptional regulator [Anaerolineae bacterium]
MKTKDRILDAALRLFNTQGTSAVSTNHIAEAAGISPGNLYYHYANKEEIIRALFERQFAVTESAFTLTETPTLADAQALVRTNFEILETYRFIYRELVALLRQDPALHAQYMNVRARGYTGFREIIAALSQSSVMRDLDDDTITQLADLCWLISEFWLSSLEISGQQADAAAMQRGVDLMMRILSPYLMP